MLITVSGPAGVGKSTATAALAEALDYDHVSGGDIFRSLADERDMTPLEFNRLAETNEQIDLDLDHRLRELAREHDDLVIESRLAGWMAGEHADVRIWFDAPLSVRASRIAEREEKSVEQAREETQARAESEALRYREYYGIDIHDRSIYDLSVNTARLGPEGVVETVLAFIRAYDPDADEGQTPVEGVTYEF
ncbi:(d)CMP kinase [Halocatena marina]|uniref:Cytidylate kinase n=1 Tax=Halocatena marina TaxID=2934937 RepID=A0ABD5YI09_9EURY|nr:AAA family ATPase [Halocatena marina]